MQNRSFDLIYEFEQLRVSSPKQPTQKARTKLTAKCNRKIKNPYKIVQNDDVMDIYLVRYSLSKYRFENSVNGALSYGILEKNSPKFEEIKAIFIKHKLRVTSVKAVINPYLKQAFELTQKMYYTNTDPMTLFHGTKEKYVENICTYNFDWRYSGSETGHRYGKGVNFSKNPYFAAFFCDKTSKGFVMQGTIIIADVLIGVISQGKENLVLPPKGSDTTRGKGSNVWVKFYDNEFYPKYIVQFVRVKS